MSDHPFHQVSGTEGNVASRALQYAVNGVRPGKAPAAQRGTRHRQDPAGAKSV